jgi:uncharacterized protein (DUF1330 family)
MATIERFNRGDEVLSKLPGGSIMTVLAVEGMKVRCSDFFADPEYAELKAIRKRTSKSIIVAVDGID